MANVNSIFIENINSLKLIRIALVYAYKDEDAKGFEHYDYWNMSVISDWANAVEEIGGIPYILDVRTFADKIINKTIPKIDYVINLNAGNKNLSTLGLVPSLCGFLAVPCIPCDTTQAVVGEHKHLSNLVAMAHALTLPLSTGSKDAKSIRKPINFGSSVGVEIGLFEKDTNYITQEFIPGFDMTVPIIYSPLSGQLECLSGILYYTNPINLNWFLDENSKLSRKEYIKTTVKLSQDIKKKFKAFASDFGIKTFCRIDTRVYCTEEYELQYLLENEIPYEKVYFLEINPMPTIKNNINFCNAIENELNSEIYNSYLVYRRHMQTSSVTGFVLACSIIALTKAMHCK